MSKIVCPKCGQPGFLAGRWVWSYTYPMYASCDVIMLKQHEKNLEKDPTNEEERSAVELFRRKIKGNMYRSEAYLRGIESKKLMYGIRSRRKYWHLYVGHYDPVLYQKEMTDYRLGKRKSRPNGRKWCKFGFRRRPKSAASRGLYYIGSNPTRNDY